MTQIKRLLTAETDTCAQSIPFTVHLPCLVDSIEYQFFFCLLCSIPSKQYADSYRLIVLKD